MTDDSTILAFPINKNLDCFIENSFDYFIEKQTEEILNNLKIPEEFLISKDDQDSYSDDIIEAIKFILDGKSSVFVDVIMKHVNKKMDNNRI